VSTGDIASEVPKRKRDPEFWIALGALAVSALAMLSSVLQVSLQRSQDRALVWPHAIAKVRYSGEGFAYIAENKGLGPALVRTVTIAIDGQLVDDWSGALERLFGPNHGYGWEQIRVNDLDDSILAPNQPVTLFGIGWDARTREVLSRGERITVTLCYCSVLGECWISRSGIDHEAVDACPINPKTDRSPAPTNR
jgi:hypothetical protein